jgi:hypothetical protein
MILLPFERELQLQHPPIIEEFEDWDIALLLPPTIMDSYP